MWWQKKKKKKKLTIDNCFWRLSRSAHWLNIRLISTTVDQSFLLLNKVRGRILHLFSKEKKKIIIKIQVNKFQTFINSGVLIVSLHIGISTFVGYLIPKSSLENSRCHLTYCWEKRGFIPFHRVSAEKWIAQLEFEHAGTPQCPGYDTPASGNKAPRVG